MPSHYFKGDRLEREFLVAHISKISALRGREIEEKACALYSVIYQEQGRAAANTGLREYVERLTGGEIEWQEKR